MSRPLDPILAVRRRALVTWVLSIPVVLLCSLWAARPIHIPVAGSLSVAPSKAGEVRVKQADPLDITAFDAALWVVPPPPVAKTPDPPPPPPEVATKFQLIGIVHDRNDGTETLRAAIYDPVADRIYLVFSGEKIGSHTVRSVTDSAVEIANGRSISRLVLDERAKGQGRKGGRS